MPEVILGLSLLFNPFSFSTPVHHISVMHMGNTVLLADVDTAWEGAGTGDEWKLYITTVMFAPMAVRRSDCLMSVSWGITQATQLGGWMIVIDPRASNDLRAAYLSQAFTVVRNNGPYQWHHEACLD